MSRYPGRLKITPESAAPIPLAASDDPRELRAAAVLLPSGTAVVKADAVARAMRRVPGWGAASRQDAVEWLQARGFEARNASVGGAVERVWATPVEALRGAIVGWASRPVVTRQVDASARKLVALVGRAREASARLATRRELEAIRAGQAHLAIDREYRRASGQAQERARQESRRVQAQYDRAGRRGSEECAEALGLVHSTLASTLGTLAAERDERHAWVDRAMELKLAAPARQARAAAEAVYFQALADPEGAALYASHYAPVVAELGRVLVDAGLDVPAPLRLVEGGEVVP